MTDFEEYLQEFPPARPAPALKERVMAAAREELRRTWVDRAWNGRTWTALAAGLILALSLLWASNRPPAALPKAASARTAPKIAPFRPRVSLPEMWLIPMPYSVFREDRP